MDGKLAVLTQLLDPQWSQTLDAFGAANDAAGGDLQKGAVRLSQCAVTLAAGGLSGSLGIEMLGSFLPPDEQTALSAATSLLRGDPIGAVMSVLPPDARFAASVAAPLLCGDLGGSLSALAGRFLPPELLPVWNAMEQTGELAGPFSIVRPNLPSPFSKPKAPEEGSADLSTDSLEDCGVAPWVARISDVVACPKGGGPIITGQMNVLAGFMPIARKTDKALCIGPPDIINDGESTVKIGGNDAARLADSTAHGGKIASGFSTVWIGKSHAPCVKIAAARRAAIVIHGPAAE